MLFTLAGYGSKSGNIVEKAFRRFRAFEGLQL